MSASAIGDPNGPQIAKIDSSGGGLRVWRRSFAVSGREAHVLLVLERIVDDAATLESAIDV